MDRRIQWLTEMRTHLKSLALPKKPTKSEKHIFKRKTRKKPGSTGQEMLRVRRVCRDCQNLTFSGSGSGGSLMCTYKLRLWTYGEKRNEDRQSSIINFQSTTAKTISIIVDINQRWLYYLVRFVFGHPVIDGFIRWFPFHENLSGFLDLVLLSGNSLLLLLNLLECVSVRPVFHESRSLPLGHEL